MKKIIVLSLILLITIATVVNVYAASNFEMSLQPSKNEVSTGEEFVVDVRISNIQLDKGVIALGGRIEYNKESLELVKMEGENTWARPSYNDDNGMFATDRNDYATNDETVFKITFKVKEQSEKKLTITLNDIAGSNGKDEVKLNNIKANITVKNGTSTPDDPKPDTNTTKDDNTNTSTNTNTNNNNNNTANDNKNNTTNNNNSVNNNTNSNSNVNNNTNNTNTNVSSNKQNIIANTTSDKKDGLIPKAGANPILFGSIGLLIVIAASFYIRIRVIDGKTKKNNIIK